MSQKVSTPSAWRTFHDADHIREISTCYVDMDRPSLFFSAVRYVLAGLATSCNAGCASVGLKCVTDGFQGQDVKKVFESVGRTCHSEEGYVWADQPCITEAGHCYGTTGLPAHINCAPGQNGSVRRLCPCA